MDKKLLARILTGMIAAALLAAPATPILAKESPKALYATTIEKYPSPKLADVEGREYKVLFEASRLNPDVSATYKDLWGKVKAAAAKQGFTIKEKEKNPLAIELATKEYFDTKDQALWGKGYLIRITMRYKDGKPGDKATVTVKSVFENAERSLAAPLAVIGVEKVKTEAEENVGYGPDGTLRGYVEKGSSFSVPLASVGKFTLGDFGKYVPELLELGLPADTALVSTKAYTYRIRPGAVVIAGTAPCGISMEAWSRTEGGTPFVYDFSFGYSDLDFYTSAETHASGERFMEKVVKGELAALIAPDSGKWGGSKVRLLMNRPVTMAAAAAPAAAPAKAAGPKAPVTFITSPTPPVDPLDAKYGVASPPAYIKHYEADKTGKVMLTPYLQVGSKDFPAVLVVKEAPYNWVIDVGGNVSITPEAAHPYGRTYPKGFFRPEDQSKRKPGTRENFGHVSILAGMPGRISGEINYDKDTDTWVINNKSGRYSKHNFDRSPEQLVNAATLIREVVDPGKTPWGQVFFLIEYSSQEMRTALMQSPKVQYDDPAKKSRPHLVVMEGGVTTFKPEEMPKIAAPASAAASAAPAASAATAPAKPAKVKKAKAAQNDDPS
ncbi:MAG: hypothetical protein IPP91_03505 [Betaproteobacteria bacterium]|nr:hypothetical protein [Betaproteobacteria bacterium]